MNVLFISSPHMYYVGKITLMIWRWGWGVWGAFLLGKNFLRSDEDECAAIL